MKVNTPRFVAPLEKALAHLIHTGNHLSAGQPSPMHFHRPIQFHNSFTFISKFQSVVIFLNWWINQWYCRCAYCTTNYTLIAKFETFKEDLWLAFNLNRHHLWPHYHHKLTSAPLRNHVLAIVEVQQKRHFRYIGKLANVTFVEKVVKKIEFIAIIHLNVDVKKI